MVSIITPVLINDLVQWVHWWRANEGKPVWLYAEEFNSPYCPINFEVTNEPL